MSARGEGIRFGGTKEPIKLCNLDDYIGKTNDIADQRKKSSSRGITVPPNDDAQMMLHY